MKKVAADSLSRSLAHSLPGSPPNTAGNQPDCLSWLSAGGDTKPAFSAAAGPRHRRRCGQELPGGAVSAGKCHAVLPTLSRLGSAPAWWPSAREPQPAAQDPPEPPCPRSAPRAPSCTDKSAPASSAGSSDTILAKLTESKSKALSHESFLGIGRSFLPFRRRLPRLLLQRGGRQPRPWSQKATLFINFECARGKAGDFCARAAGAGASASSRHFSLKKVC